MAMRTKPKCSLIRTSNIALQYVDESARLDGTLDTLAMLCEAVGESAELSHELLAGIGEAMREYLEKRRLLEHAFFNRTLSYWQRSDLAAKAELTRLRRVMESK